MAKTFQYQKSDGMPQEMKNDLLNAAHAGEAEKIFNKYEDVFFVEIRSRASVWLNL